MRAILAFFGGLSSTAWEWVAVAVVVAAFTGFVYHQGGEAPRAELAATHAAIAQARAAHDAEDARRERQSAATIKEKEDESKRLVLATATAWKSYYDGVQHSIGRGGQGAKPVPPVTRVCEGQDANDRLSHAIADYRQGVRDAFADYRLGIGHLLEVCTNQANDLKLMVEWALAEQRINQ